MWPENLDHIWLSGDAFWLLILAELLISFEIFFFFHHISSLPSIASYGSPFQLNIPIFSTLAELLAHSTYSSFDLVVASNSQPIFNSLNFSNFQCIGSYALLFCSILLCSRSRRNPRFALVTEAHCFSKQSWYCCRYCWSCCLLACLLAFMLTMQSDLAGVSSVA